MAAKLKVRKLSNWSITATLILAFACIALSLVGIQKYEVLHRATRDYIASEQAARKLQKGSDTLTRQVRLAAATGRQEYIEGYFQEANVTRSRQTALEELSDIHGDPKAIEELELALADSEELMQTEYRAMRLLEEALHLSESAWPEELRQTELTAQEEALSDVEKRELARDLVTGPEYEQAKEKITGEVDASLEALTQEISERQLRASQIFYRVLIMVIGCVVLFAFIMLAVSLILRHWVVKPLLRYTDSIRHGVIFPVSGAQELQMLAKTYNDIYLENQEREMLMKRQAEHDALTGILNRGSYDRILELYLRDGSNFALILVDVDTFKHFNDTYGHAVGDQILKKVAALLVNTFRAIDYVCRIGGDEFAVIMVDMTTDLSYTIEEKVTDMNHQLENPTDGIPAVSLSVGVAFTDRPDPGPSLFKDADKALYYTKEHGKGGCCIYPLPTA